MQKVCVPEASHLAAPSIRRPFFPEQLMLDLFGRRCCRIPKCNIGIINATLRQIWFQKWKLLFCQTSSTTPRFHFRRSFANLLYTSIDWKQKMAHYTDLLCLIRGILKEFWHWDIPPDRCTDCHHQEGKHNSTVHFCGNLNLPFQLQWKSGITPKEKKQHSAFFKSASGVLCWEFNLHT